MQQPEGNTNKQSGQQGGTAGQAGRPAQDGQLIQGGQPARNEPARSEPVRNGQPGLDMRRNWRHPVKYVPVFDYDRCSRCGLCARACTWGEIRLSPEKVVDGKPVLKPYANRSSCGACHYCERQCPEEAITIIETPFTSSHNYWRSDQKNLWRQADPGSPGHVLLISTGADSNLISYFDRLMFDACQVTNPAIDPLREPMELRTFLGRRDLSGRSYPPLLEAETPILFSAMSFGSVNLKVQQAVARAARELGTMWNTGEGGLHESLYDFGNRTIVQVASGRFGVNPRFFENSAAVEIKIGQGAKPGIGGHLPGEKVTGEISQTRMIPEGSDALSPAPHHDIYSIEDLRQLIYAIKEITRYTKPVSVKVSAVHNIAPIVAGIARAGADIIAIDGFRGGTGAAPRRIRQSMGIPIEVAISAADLRLRQERIRDQVSLIAAGGIRNSADVLRAICLGADAVYLGTAVLVALGCGLCQRCYASKCAYGITTNRPDLAGRIDVDCAIEALVNLVQAWSDEIKELMGGMGINTIGSLVGNRERLRGIHLTTEELRALGVKQAGE
jgi:glutamate synthase domain-containing protein 2/NAD-dependent dihydropyrimidine dehydrogenase PreA subunit